MKLAKLLWLPAVLVAGSALAADKSADRSQYKEYRGAVEVGKSVKPVSVQVDMKRVKQAPAWQPGMPIVDKPRRTFPVKPGVHNPRGYGEDPLRNPGTKRDAQSPTADKAFATPDLNFDGTDFTGANPGDPNGDVGRDYYIQTVNGAGGATVAIFDKTDGTLAIPPFELADLAVGAGTGCTNIFSDPVVVYDSEADNGNGRWFLAEFTGNSLCAFVSQTPDPTAGSWFIYEFPADSGGVPDYHKYGVWSDAYYVGSNEGPPRAYAFDRDNMLLGNAARPAQVFSFPTLSGFGFQVVQPADADDAPPPGTPGIFMRHRDDEAHPPSTAGSDTLEIFTLSIDWDTPANSVLAGPIAIEVSELDSELCGFFAFACVPQPNSGTQLDPLREPVMWRLQYRQVGGIERLIGTFVTDVDGNDTHGVRWFELNKSGNDWNLAQEGLISPDSVNRWMSSIAMDGDGNIAVGYNVSDATSVFPGIRYSGRLAGDAPGTMQAEAVLVDGASPNGSNRYGDYNSMSVDPVDNCTFWYTGLYNQNTGWTTRVGAFKFDACGDPGFTLAADNTNLEVCRVPGDVPPVNLTIGSVQDFTGDVSLSLDNPPAGVGASFTPNPVAIPGNSVAQITIGGATPAGNNVIAILGTAAGADDRLVNVNLNVVDAAADAPTLISPADGASGVSLSPTFNWDAAATATGYTIEIATDAAFTNIVESATVGTNSYTSGGLDTQTQYFWRVRASNVCGESANSAVSTFSTGQLICSAPGTATIDNDSISDLLSVGDSGELVDLNLSINLPHTWVGDLQIALEHDGTSVLLLDRPGRDDTGFGCDGNNINNVFDDAGDLSAEDGCSTPDAYPADAVLIPNEALAAFNGAELSGDWSLTVTDNAGGDGGSLDEWCLIPELATTAGDFNEDGCVDVDDMALLIAEIRARTDNPDFDLNGDGRVNSRDRRVLIGLYTNPRGARCE